MLDRRMGIDHDAWLQQEEVKRVKLSARNQLPGTVSSINKGEAIANVVLDVGGQRLVASITVEAVDELGLAEGSQVTAIVKASDVLVATD
jgi:molybdopterin-binding protein